MDNTSNYSTKFRLLHVRRENVQAALFVLAIFGAGGLSSALHYNFVNFDTAAAGAGYMLGYVAIASGFAFSRANRKENAFPRERIGDNAYYLGFFFTLTALMSAFAQYAGVEDASQKLAEAANSALDANDPKADSVDKVLNVVSKGGLALSTTIVGISIRAIFRQWETEEQSGIGQAGLSPSIVRRFNETLNESIGSMKGMTASLRETSEALAKTSNELQPIDQFSRQASESAGKLKEFNVTGTKLSDDVLSIQRAVGKIVESAERLSEATRLLPTVLPKIVSDVELLSATINRAGDRATQISNDLVNANIVHQRPKGLFALLTGRFFGSTKP